jgi:hypothetical protein
MADDILTFRTPPFSADGSTKFLYLDAPRRRILADLIAHVCDGQGPILLVAEPGMGKSTLLDRLADEATAHNIRVVFCLTDVAAIANTTEADPQPPTAFLLDDGSAIPLGVWHQLVALLRSASPTAPGTAPKRLPPIVIALTPDLLDWLVEASLVPRNAPLDRVFRLPPFAPRDVGRFISLGLRVAGVDDRPEVFGGEAVDRIALATEGVPARIIRVCEAALAEAARRGRKEVSLETVDAAAVLVAAEMPKPIAATSAAQPLFQPEPSTEPPIQPPGLDAAPSIGIVGDGYAPVTAARTVRRRVRRRRIPVWSGIALAAGVTGVGAVATLGYVAGPNVPRPPAIAPAAPTGDPAVAALESRPLLPPTVVEPNHASTESVPILAQPDNRNDPLAESPRNTSQGPAADAQPTGLSVPASPAPIEKPIVAPTPSPTPVPTAPAQTAPAPARELAVTPRPSQAPKAARAAPAAERPQPRTGQSRGDETAGRDRKRAEEAATVEASESAADGGHENPGEGQPRPIKELIAMGDEFRDAGDTEWARRLYRAAQERGSAKAAVAEAETHDPQYAAASSRPNPDEARRLYSEAARQGDREAARRLEDLDRWISERSSR